MGPRIRHERGVDAAGGDLVGRGRGVFPTIDAFIYRETLTNEQRDDAHRLSVRKKGVAAYGGIYIPASVAWLSGSLRDIAMTSVMSSSCSSALKLSTADIARFRKADGGAPVLSRNTSSKR